MLKIDANEYPDLKIIHNSQHYFSLNWTVSYVLYIMSMIIHKSLFTVVLLHVDIKYIKKFSFDVYPLHNLSNN